ncbi:MSCRAMM family adhesin SdrC [Corynebacterium sp. TAE3-ERU16]|uniref:MSCRAMM family adhesin SdrC n=1 Tax=Corynebacterium sp. TAE3-ERU16 TaxID=2849493 RepID=UPI001C45BB5B|nr:MSCRAMM family adhesin SdrC [Corynebacterium sp. TAE3-ERU16]MBV7292220.1 MSCRAMM family adhesin SdrC [Corynebacterium sp. TAE3-ERU16]
MYFRRTIGSLVGVSLAASVFVSPASADTFVYAGSWDEKLYCNSKFTDSDRATVLSGFLSSFDYSEIVQAEYLAKLDHYAAVFAALKEATKEPSFKKSWQLQMKITKLEQERKLLGTGEEASERMAEIDEEISQLNQGIEELAPANEAVGKKYGFDEASSVPALWSSLFRISVSPSEMDVFTVDDDLVLFGATSVHAHLVGGAGSLPDLSKEEFISKFEEYKNRGIDSLMGNGEYDSSIPNSDLELQKVVLQEYKRIREMRRRAIQDFMSLDAAEAYRAYQRISASSSACMKYFDQKIDVEAIPGYMGPLADPSWIGFTLDDDGSIPDGSGDGGSIPDGSGDGESASDGSGDGESASDGSGDGESASDGSGDGESASDGSGDDTRDPDDNAPNPSDDNTGTGPSDNSPVAAVVAIVKFLGGLLAWLTGFFRDFIRGLNFFVGFGN